MRKLSILLNKNDEEFMLQFILSPVKGEIIDFPKIKRMQQEEHFN